MDIELVSTDPTCPGREVPSLRARGAAGEVPDSVISPHSRRNYTKALDELFRFIAGRPLSRAHLMEFRASMDGLAPSTVNVRLSGVRKLVTEARRNGLLGAEEAAHLTESRISGIDRVRAPTCVRCSNHPKATRLRFGSFELNSGATNFCARCNRIKLERIPMGLLLLLLERGGEVCDAIRTG